MPELCINFEENLSLALGKSAEQNEVLGSYKIIIDYFIIIIFWLNYFMYINFSSRNNIRYKMWQQLGLLLLLV